MSANATTARTIVPSRSRPCRNFMRIGTVPSLNSEDTKSLCCYLTPELSCGRVNTSEQSGQFQRSPVSFNER